MVKYKRKEEVFMADDPKEEVQAEETGEEAVTPDSEEAPVVSVETPASETEVADQSEK